MFNNAAICIPGTSPEVLRRTLSTNFFGALRVQAALLPLMEIASALDVNTNDDGEGGDDDRCIVNVSSGDGELCLLSTRLQSDLAVAQTPGAVAAALRAAAARANAGEELAFGPTPAYSVSKAALNAATRICGGAAAAARGGGVRIVAVCPGDVDTAMLDAAPAGPVLSAAAAAADVAWAARPAGGCPSGGFYRARAVIPW